MVCNVEGQRVRERDAMLMIMMTDSDSVWDVDCIFLYQIELKMCVRVYT